MLKFDLLSHPHPLYFICLIVKYRISLLYSIPHMSCLYYLSVKKRFVLYCIVVTNKTFLIFHTFEIKTELPCCLMHYLALTPMWRKSSTLTPLRSRSLFISCMTKTEVIVFMAGGSGGWFLPEKPTASTLI